MTNRYSQSLKYFERASAVIPLGSQTFSKSVTQYAPGSSPLALNRGVGCRVWDVDGHEYLDFVNGLLAVILGYCDPDVDHAVRQQLSNGTVLSLPHPLEAEVAEAICELVPSAEMVRFGKNGSDATAGAVRLARAFTGRDHVLVCGYHGWQDWYIGSTARNLGVPSVVRELTHQFAFNDQAGLETLFKAHRGGVACVVMEPMASAWPADGYLAAVQALCRREGALLIFDETITGFRFATGGAQALFGIMPDLTTLGKGLANGFPLSAVCGRRDVMRLMEEIFFSFTLGGETLSLAAAKATLTKIRREPVVETLRVRGERLMKGVSALIVRHRLEDIVSIKGHPAWSFLDLASTERTDMWDTKSLLLQEVFERGVLTLGTHNMSYAHTEDDVDRLLAIYDEVLPAICEAARSGAVETRLRAKPIRPLFRVRN